MRDEEVAGGQQQRCDGDRHEARAAPQHAVAHAGRRVSQQRLRQCWLDLHGRRKRKLFDGAKD
eukprot:5382347-Prymnesium_polylepis.1